AKARESMQMMPDSANYTPNKEEEAVLRWIYRFGEVVADAAENFAPNTLTTYLYELAQRYNAFYNAHSVMQADTDEAKAFRVQLTEASTQVLKNGLQLLGI